MFCLLVKAEFHEFGKGNQHGFYHRIQIVQINVQKNISRLSRRIYNDRREMGRAPNSHKNINKAVRHHFKNNLSNYHSQQYITQ